MNKALQRLIILFIFLTSCQEKTTQKEKGTPENKIGITDSTDRAIFKSIKEIAYAQALDSMAVENRVIEVAKMFLQTPYAGGTLENENGEKLLVNFRELDCTTYLENVVALSRIFGKEGTDEGDFLKELEYLRYRNGKLTNYSSRLHYFTDWIFNNEKKGILEDITTKIGGEKYNKNINFMSTHVDSYAALKADTSLLAVIRATEKQINQRNLYYIPEEKIKSIENKIRNGDLIAITTKIEGLEILHVGIALHVNNRLHLIHASSVAQKVVVSDKPLAEMLLSNKDQSGIMVVRLKEPTNHNLNIQ